MGAKLCFYGGAKTVTGSCFVLSLDELQIMVDCGLFQGSKEIKERNYKPFPFDPCEIDYLLLTHAHIDHSGLIPKLCKSGFRGKIYATTATVELCKVMLPDSGHIQEMEVERKNRKYRRAGKPLITPIYTAQDARDCMKFFNGVDYNQTLALSPNVSVRFLDAGHILGSAFIEITLENLPVSGSLKLLFTGDIGNYDQPIINDPSQVEAADILIMESTYGDRVHSPNGDILNTLSSLIRETFRRGGNVIVPSFAVGRMQDLLYYLNLLIERGDINPKDVYIDSPLGVATTEIFCNSSEYYDLETRELKSKEGRCPLHFPGLHYSITPEDSTALNKIKQGAIIISASGMCDAGRIKHHLKHNLWRPECLVLFVGYQAEGTLGRRILDGEKLVRIHGEEISVKAQVYSIDSLSAHADKNGMIKWLKGFKTLPRKVFLVHGEEDVLKSFSALLEQELGLKVEVPDYLQTVELLPDHATVKEEALVDLEDLNKLIMELKLALETTADEGQARKLLQSLKRAKAILAS